MAKHRRIVVLGAGLIGAAMVRAARRISSDSEIVLLSRSLPEHLSSMLSPGEAAIGEIGKGGLRGLLKDGDVVFACHGLAAPRTPLNEARQLVVPVLEASTELLEEVASLSGTDLIVFSSGGSVYGETTEPVTEMQPVAPESVYGVTKVAEELLLQQLHGDRDNRVTRLRVATLYSAPGFQARTQGLVQLVIRLLGDGREVPVYGRGRSLRDYVHVDDLADLALMIAQREGSAEGYEVFNVGTGTVHSILDVIGLVAESMGVDSPKLRFTEGPEFDVVLDVGRLRETHPDWSPRPLARGLAEILSARTET